MTPGEPTRRAFPVLWAVLLQAALRLAFPAVTAGQSAPRGLDLSRPVTYFIAEASSRSGARPGDRALAEWALQAWGRQLDPALSFVAAPEPSADVRIYWVTAEEGLFGETRTRSADGRLAADVFVQPNTDGFGTDIARQARRDPLFRDAIVYLTCVHELGHALGLAHTRAFADIMYSFQYGGDFVAYFMRFRDQLHARDDIRTTSPFSAADRAALRSARAASSGR